MTQVAQKKFELQEDKLRDVARHMMALLRDYHKLSFVEVTRKVTETRKCLLKYEMQHVRIWALQERNRRKEIDDLFSEAERLQDETEKEADNISALGNKEIKERQRKKRYEEYERAAAEINRKRTRAESQAEIDKMNNEIKRMRQRKVELEERVEQRNRRAQLLRHAVVDLKFDLQNEQESFAEALGSSLGGQTAGGVGGQGKAPQAGLSTAPPVEVIS